MEKKLTKKELFAELRVLAEDAERQELIDFIDHEVDLLTKKTSNKKPTENQKANEEIKNEIVAALKKIGEPVTISELFVKAPNIAEKVGGSNQKVSALMRQMGDVENGGDGRVKKIADKKRSLFTVAE